MAVTRSPSYSYGSSDRPDRPVSEDGRGQDPLGSLSRPEELWDLTQGDIGSAQSGIDRNVENARGVTQDAMQTILGLGNSDFFDPNGQFANAFRTNVQNLTQQNIERGLSAAGGRMGARGISGAPEEALRARITTQALGQQSQAESDIMGMLLNARTPIAQSQIAGTTGLGQNLAGLEANKDVLSPDRLGFLSTTESFDAWKKGIDAQMSAEERANNLARNPFEWLAEGNVGMFIWSVINSGAAPALLQPQFALGQ